MSVTWRPAPQQQHVCGHPRCAWLRRISAACMIAAYLALAWLLIMPSVVAIATGGVLLAAGFTAICWPCPRRGDLEALIDATREPRAATRHERAGQPFGGLRGHFEAWEKELDQR